MVPVSAKLHDVLATCRALDEEIREYLIGCLSDGTRQCMHRRSVDPIPHGMAYHIVFDAYHKAAQDRRPQGRRKT